MPGDDIDPFDLGRFVRAQDENGAYARARLELRGGRKTSHWIWFVFPQIRGLGSSPMAQKFAISGLSEAQAYLAHLTLGPRLRACCAMLLDLKGSSAEEIFGDLDAMKLRSSMTLFAKAADGGEPFTAVLARYFGGAPDPRTLEKLGG